MPSPTTKLPEDAARGLEHEVAKENEATRSTKNAKIRAAAFVIFALRALRASRPPAPSCLRVPNSRLPLLLGLAALLALAIAACTPQGLPATKAPERTAWAATRAASTVEVPAAGGSGKVAAAAETRVPPTPTPTRTPTLTPAIVTPRPRPTDVLEAATVSAAETAQAEREGTPTATPPNMITATFTPRPFAVTKTPTPGDTATAQYVAFVATAAAFTTGTPTPFPTWVFVATETPTPTPFPTLTPLPPPTATPPFTPTPVWIAWAKLSAWAQPTPTPVAPFPPALMGKILFLSDYTGSKQAFAVNPDGSDVVQLTNAWPYQLAQDRDAYSADRTYYAFPERDKDGSNRLVQLYYYDYRFQVKRLLTEFGTGTAWAPAWSPTDDLIAFVSNESDNDEIWVVRKDQLPPQQLTHNTWEWDHHPSWSPDGAQIVFSSNRSGRQQLWLMQADGSNPRPLTDGSFEAWDPVWVKYTK